MPPSILAAAQDMKRATGFGCILCAVTQTTSAGRPARLSPVAAQGRRRRELSSRKRAVLRTSDLVCTVRVKSQRLDRQSTGRANCSSSSDEVSEPPRRPAPRICVDLIRLIIGFRAMDGLSLPLLLHRDRPACRQLSLLTVATVAFGAACAGT
jgi:hypothetical protein